MCSQCRSLGYGEGGGEVSLSHRLELNDVLEIEFESVDVGETAAAITNMYDSLQLSMMIDHAPRLREKMSGR